MSNIKIQSRQDKVKRKIHQTSKKWLFAEKNGIVI